MILRFFAFDPAVTARIRWSILNKKSHLAHHKADFDCASVACKGTGLPTQTPYGKERPCCRA